MLNSVFSFIVAIGILVFLHELGHYAVARFFNVKVIRFSVGFGRPLIRWVSKQTGVEWTLCWIPMGGYVRMLDERDPESVSLAQGDLDNAFNRKPVLQRMAVVLAGPVANLIVAALLYTALMLNQSTQLQAVVAQPQSGSLLAQAGLQAADRIIQVNQAEVDDWNGLNWAVLGARLYRDDLQMVVERGGVRVDLKLDAQRLTEEPFSPQLPNQLGLRPYEKRVLVKSVMPGSPAEQAGFQTGDELKALNGQALLSSGAFTEQVSKSAQQVVQVEIVRAGQLLTIQATPERVPDGKGGSRGRLGLGIAGDVMIQEVDHSLFVALGLGVQKTFEISTFSLAAMGSMLSGDLSWSNLSGPVTIASAAGESSSLGIWPFIGFMAMVSVSLGILNLLPIPVLDGGHLMYYFAELLRGRPLDEAWQQWGQKLGLMVIGLLTCLAFFNDIHRLLS